MPYFYLYREVTSHQLDRSGNTKGGSITVPLTSCSTGLDQSVLQIKAKKFQLSYRWFQTSQTGGQWYSDTSPFSIPWIDTQVRLGSVRLGKVGLGRIEESFIKWVRRKNVGRKSQLAVTVSSYGLFKTNESYSQGRHDIEHNDTRHNSTQQNNSQINDTRLNSIMHNER